MTAQVATLEKVREAHEQLLRQGLPASANNIQALTGGSKTTILPLLAIVRAEVAAAQIDENAAPALLRELAEPLVQKVWSAARKHAQLEADTRLHHLLSVQSGLAADLEEISANEQEARKRIEQVEAEVLALRQQLQKERELREAAEELSASLQKAAGEAASQLERAHDVEKELRARLESADQLGTIIRLLEANDRPHSGKSDDTGTVASTSLSALTIVMETMSKSSTPITSSELDATVTATGHSASATQKARFNAKKSGYIEELDGKLAITELGRAWVTKRRPSRT